MNFCLLSKTFWEPVQVLELIVCYNHSVPLFFSLLSPWTSSHIAFYYTCYFWLILLSLTHGPPAALPCIINSHDLSWLIMTHSCFLFSLHYHLYLWLTCPQPCSHSLYNTHHLQCCSLLYSYLVSPKTWSFLELHNSWVSEPILT